ncbi:Zn-ribbon containing protein [Halobacteria archaeon AArc-curdl1]|uniref:Zn-ribbon containing protein n=1 Tax=Natronosalvus hydrolyticus TaxID=2979988 RepID=A0AAP2ZBZ8_9EURY|nr:Zn-ribbon containing protein [Halobacteria archaeon AArc-curdl1]
MPHQCTNCGRTFPDGSKEMLSGCPDCGGNKFQFAPTQSSSGGGVTTQSQPKPSADERSRGITDQSPEEPTSTRADSSPSETAFPEWPDSARRPEDRSGADRREADREKTVAEHAAPDRIQEPDSGDQRKRESGDQRERESSDKRPESSSDQPIHDAPAEREHDQPEQEDTAQASARSDIVSSDELPPVTDTPSEPDSNDGRAVSEPDSNDGRVVSEPDSSDERPSLEELREELNEQFESIKIVRPGEYELNLMELYNREEYIVSLQEDGRYVIDVPDSWRDE